MIVLFLCSLVSLLLNTTTIAVTSRKASWPGRRCTGRTTCPSPSVGRNNHLPPYATTSDRWTDMGSTTMKNTADINTDGETMPPTSTSTGKKYSWEDKLRGAIVNERLEDAIKLVQGLRSTRLSSGRDIVYVITETSRRAGNIQTIALPLLAAIPLNRFDMTKEDDIMPMLSDSIKSTNGVTTSYRIVLLLTERGVSFTAKAYSVLMKGFGLQRNEQMVDRLLIDGGNNNLISDVILFNTAIDAYIRCNHQKKAISLFDFVVRDMLSSSDNSRITTVSSISWAKGKKATQDPTVRDALRKKLMGSDELMAKLNQRGVSSENSQTRESLSTTIGSNNPTRAVTRGNDYLKALSKSFIDGKVRPNVRSYNTLLKAIKGSGGGSFERCMDIILTMQRQGIQPDSVTINTLVDVSVNSGNLQAAEELLAQPMAVPGVEAYTALISGYASLGNVEEAFRILDRMYERKINPNIFTLTSLMKTCVMREDWGRARELLAMGDRYLTPLHGVDNNGINRGANAAGVDNTRNNGLVMVNQLATLRGSLVIGLCQMSMSSDIDSEDKELFLNEAQRELLRMELDGMKPDTATLNAFIQGLCAIGSNIDEFTTTISGKMGSGQRVTDALLVLRAMRREQIEPDDYTYSILFAALGREGYVNEALQLFKSARKQMDATAVNALLRAFVSGQDPLKTIRLYQELISTNSSIWTHAEFGHFEPTKYTFTILFAALTKIISPESIKDRRIVPNTNNNNAPSSLRSWNPDVTKGTKNKESVFRSKYLGALSSMENANTTDMRAMVIDTTLIATSTSDNKTQSFSPRTILGQVINNIVIIGKTSLNDRLRETAGTSNGMSNKPTQPLIYDNVQGRFYEQNNVVISTESITNNSTSSSVPSDSDSSIASSDVSKVSIIDTETKTEKPRNRNVVSRDADLMSMGMDELLQSLYRTMRYDREIDPDEIMVGALNTLFASQGTFRNSENTLLTNYDSGLLSSSSSSGSGNIGGRWGKRTVFSKRSAELVFEDLAISGWHPTQLRPILRSCSYPPHQMEELLREGDDNLVLTKLRSNAASVRIFKKHGWNKMESGWSGFF